MRPKLPLEMETFVFRTRPVAGLLSWIAAPVATAPWASTDGAGDSATKGLPECGHGDEQDKYQRQRLLPDLLHWRSSTAIRRDGPLDVGILQPEMWVFWAGPSR
jgi:hypothetical protein